MSKKRDFDVATDEMRFEIVKHLTDRNKKLRTQLAEKDKIIEGLQEYRKEVEKNIKAEVDERCSDIIKDYEIKLEEKDKEILELKEFNAKLWYQQVVKTRHEICEKIRKKVTVASGAFSNVEEVLLFKQFLDQVEKGEEVE